MSPGENGTNETVYKSRMSSPAGFYWMANQEKANTHSFFHVGSLNILIFYFEAVGHLFVCISVKLPLAIKACCLTGQMKAHFIHPSIYTYTLAEQTLSQL